MAAQGQRSLYKYFTFNDYSINAVELGSVWLSNPSAFNDPYDCGITIDQIKYIERERGYYDSMYPMGGKNRDWSAIARAPVPGWVISVAKADLRKRFNSIGVCSFSEDNLSILMWSHYGDKHQGFCVEYKFDNIAILSKEIRKVAYVSDIPSITIEEYNRYDENEKRDYVDRLAVYKSNDWAYEKEWRLVADYNNSYYKENIKIGAIYLGTRFDNSNKEKINAIIEKNEGTRSIEIHQLIKLENSFQLKVMSN